MNSNYKLDIAYIAGLFDGEGNVSYKKYPKKILKNKPLIEVILSRFNDDGTRRQKKFDSVAERNAYLINEQYSKLVNKKIELKKRKKIFLEDTRYYVEDIRKYVVDKFGFDEATKNQKFFSKIQSNSKKELSIGQTKTIEAKFYKIMKEFSYIN